MDLGKIYKKSKKKPEIELGKINSEKVENKNIELGNIYNDDTKSDIKKDDEKD